MFLLSDKGGAVLSSVVEYYLDSSSSQALLLLSSIREPHHKVLLEKLNESVSRSGTRLGALTLLGHLIRKQPPWVHHISRSPLLLSLLRCLKLHLLPAAALQHEGEPGHLPGGGEGDFTSHSVLSRQPMLEHVRVHPELVTGTQDYELDPSR
uniref:Uncharacterized protein n=1 Tax=Neolamprologus brichardi TaxID=32507 RepID=A0A3Q4IC59_NEOBR